MLKVYQYKSDNDFVTGKSPSGHTYKVEIDQDECFAIIDDDTVKIGSAIVYNADIENVLKYAKYVNDMSYMDYVTFYNDMLNGKHNLVNNIVNQSDHTITDQTDLIMRGVKFKKF